MSTKLVKIIFYKLENRNRMGQIIISMKIWWTKANVSKNNSKTKNFLFPWEMNNSEKKPTAPTHIKGSLILSEMLMS